MVVPRAPSDSKANKTMRQLGLAPSV
jgi:chromate reductase, NAD(P)H dehydrogenase (quinone)